MATAVEILKDVTALLQDRGLKVKELSDDIIETLDVTQAIINVNMVLSLFTPDQVSTILACVDYCRYCGNYLCDGVCMRDD